MKPQPLTLPKIAADEASLTNELVGRCRKCQLQIGQEVVSVEFHAEMAQTQIGTWWKIAAGDAPLWIALDDFRVFAEIQQLIGNVAWEQLPEEVARLVLESVFDGLLNDVRQRTELPLELVGPATPESAAQADAGIGFTLTCSDGNRCLGTMRFGRELTAAITRLAGSAEAVPQFDPSEVPIPVHVEVGRSVLSTIELRGLQLFDVVLMDYTEFMNENRVYVRCGSGLGFHGTVDHANLTLEDLVVQQDDGDSLLAAQGTDDVPCELRFELARLAVPLGDFTSIQPGHRLNLPQYTAGRVSVIAGNITLGSGELVQIGNRAGVRLDRIDAGLSGYHPR